MLDIREPVCHKTVLPSRSSQFLERKQKSKQVDSIRAIGSCLGKLVAQWAPQVEAQLCKARMRKLFGSAVF